MIEQIKKRLAKGETVRFKVKVVPGSSRNMIAGTLGTDESGTDIIKIKIAAAPEKGKANAELVDFLAESLSVRKNAVQIVAGHTSHLKTIIISP